KDSTSSSYRGRPCADSRTQDEPGYGPFPSGKGISLTKPYPGTCADRRKESVVGVRSLVRLGEQVVGGVVLFATDSSTSTTHILRASSSTCSDLDISDPSSDCSAILENCRGLVTLSEGRGSPLIIVGPGCPF